jgi:hypothetical protein
MFDKPSLGRISIFRVRKLIQMAIMLNIRIDKSQIEIRLSAQSVVLN